MSADTSSVRVRLPAPLCTMAGVERELALTIAGPVTQRTVLDAVESAHPALVGTIRNRSDRRRRAFIRFFACEEDLSHEDPDAPLPAAVAEGREPYLVLGAMAGG